MHKRERQCGFSENLLIRRGIKLCRIFVFGNAFAIRNIIPVMDIVFSCGIESIVVLEDIAPNGFLPLKNIRINSVRRIENGVENSDITFIIRDDTVPNNSIDNAKKCAKRLRKRYIEITNPWTDCNYRDFVKQLPLFDEIKNHPVVLNISLGTLSQPTCGELACYQALSNSQVKVKQFFSNQTYDFLSQINNNYLLNKQINLCQSEIAEYDVLLASLNIGLSIYNLSEYYYLVNLLSPDCIIVQVDNSFKDFEKINHIISSLCLSDIDIVLQSHFNLFDNKHIVYENKNDNTNKRFIDLEDDNLENKLSFEMLSKISLPAGIVGF